MNFTDLQVLTLIKAHPGQSYQALARIAHDEMIGAWTAKKIQRAAARLQAAGKIKVVQGTVSMEVPCFKLYGVVSNGR